MVSERIWNFIPYNKKLIENKISSVEINFPNKKIKLNFVPKMLALNRKALDKYVANLAKKSGARIILNRKVLKIDKANNKFLVKTNKETYEFDYIIGCDGPLSVVREFLRLKQPKLRLGILCYDNKKNRSEMAITYASRHGFSWIVPRGNRSEYGVLEIPHTAKEEFAQLLKKQKIKAKKIYSALVPQTLILPDNDRVALCGDSCGTVKTWSGGGIIWGLTAADILIKNFPNIKKYNDEFRKFFEPRFLFSNIATKIAMKAGFDLPQILPKEVLFDSDWIY